VTWEENKHLNRAFISMNLV